MLFAQRISTEVTDTAVIASINLPGYKPSTMKVLARGSLDGYIKLKVSAAKSAEDADSKKEFDVILNIDPSAVSIQRATAKAEDGVLTVTLPISRSLQEKEIPVA